ncbi:hypothetical protein JCM19037_4097 [Geomicrobium sp. JCM 19037]|nr:hypothetical protein JCM19037_4097 [Geomicrobium sp. JCM 19037]
MFSSGNLNDGKAAIALLKGLKKQLPDLDVTYYTVDTGCDAPAIYQQVHQQESRP